MLVRQSKNTFIRCYDNYGYITNQMTYYDRTYNEIGADFLKSISRVPQDIETIITDKLIPLYNGVTKLELENDFINFIQDLERNLFVVTGETTNELDAKDLSFSYSLDNPKTMINDFTQITDVEIKENTQTFFLERAQHKPQLIALQFELTSRCNERCIHCYIPNGKKDAGKDMPTKKVFEILDQFAAMGGLHVTLSGGEVFMHKDILKIIAYCREKDLKITILSNLISLREAQIPFIKAANVSLIQVSLYSMDPKIHDTITTIPNSFVRTKRAIEKLIEADIPVQISCPIMKANKDGYKDVLAYAQDHKIKAQTDYIMMAQADFGTENLANRISIAETERVIRDIIEYDIDYSKETLISTPISNNIRADLERFSKQPICGVGQDNCCITENGDVYPCAGWQAYVLGNIYEQSLSDIWNNSERIKYLRTIKQSNFPKCLKCEARDYCAMCLVRNFNESGGDMFKTNDHFCKVAFLNKRLVEEYKEKGLI